MTVEKRAWQSFIPVCCKVESPSPKHKKQNNSLQRLVALWDLSSSEDLSNSLAGSNLHVFTFEELRMITHCFSSSNFLGEGGFGPVHKGVIDDKLRPGLKAQPVAVKVLDLDGFQGHREWLDIVVKMNTGCWFYEYMPRGYSVSLPWSVRMKIALGAAKGLAFLHQADKPVIYRDFKASNILLDSDYNAKLSDFGLATDGPEGDDTHVSTRVVGTEGYTAPEYLMTERTEPSSVGKAQLKNLRKLNRIIDPRLEGQYCESGAQKAASLAYQCLSHQPKLRPTMSTVVDTLEPLKDFNDISLGPFVYTVGDLHKENPKVKL
ncbi:unnamed protein product [Ilex paraguariensis]|uniref:Protein kinase domain-containing protein n=1 Tax=Ilex paraguariensis TaxID=185542 RepID=A0ABC8TB81_9AQUA